jgi:GNAT superfamily N-acetyltransferase
MKIGINHLRFSLLSDDSEIGSFACSDEDLNSFLKDDAKKYQQERMARTYLTHYKTNLVGYFTLVNDNISTREVEEEDRQNWFLHSKYPAIKIARLATCSVFERRGIGRNMLKMSVNIALQNISQYSGCRIITVDSKKDALEFYRKYGWRIAIRKRGDTIPLYRDFYKMENR